MLAYQRSQCIDQVEWNKSRWGPSSKLRDALLALECWKYDSPSTNSSRRNDENFRVTSLADAPREPGILRCNVEEVLEKWLKFEGQYAPPPPPPRVSKLQGGLRVLFVERNGMYPAISMSRAAFEAVEKVFDLHPSTLPALLAEGGMFCHFAKRDSDEADATRTETSKRMHFVIKAPQKVEIANYVLSVSYDVDTGWANALICGEGVIYERPSDSHYGSLREQLLRAITLSAASWDSPLVLPCVLLQNCVYRMSTRCELIDRKMIELENDMGMTTAGRAAANSARIERWPQIIQPKEMTLRLHSLAPQIVFLLKCCKWQRSYSDFLKMQASHMAGDKALRRHWADFDEARQSILLWSSLLEGIEAQFNTFRERASLQLNLLFSIISQQDSILNRFDSKTNQLIAESTKKDSISMTTFTLITAVFLPGTFTATLFSMSMFNWQLNTGGSGGGGGISSGTTAGGSMTDQYVSNKFWIYWLVSISLTVFTLLCWRLWFMHTWKKWRQNLHEKTQTHDDEEMHKHERRKGHDNEMR